MIIHDSEPQNRENWTSFHTSYWKHTPPPVMSCPPNFSAESDQGSRPNYQLTGIQGIRNIVKPSPRWQSTKSKL